MVKRCEFCGRFFNPVERVGKRKKACHRSGCKEAREKIARLEWYNRNQGYFKGRYWYVKEWRKRGKQSLSASTQKMIQDDIPQQGQSGSRCSSYRWVSGLR